MNHFCLAKLFFVVALIPQSVLAFKEIPPTQVPVVRISTFDPGRSWTWDYHEGEQFYSSERYTVIERSGDRVVMEMATRLKPNDPYRPHHRLEVELSQCLSAYANPVARKPWLLHMFYLDHDASWKSFDPGTTLAFEEKFNCNPHVYRGYGASYRTEFTESALGAVFEQKRWGRLDGTRFFLKGPNAAVAAEKRFAKPKGESYSFRFVVPDINVASGDGV